MRRLFQIVLHVVATLLLEGLFWFLDKRWGDAMFEWLKQRLPDDGKWLLPVLEAFWDYGVPVAILVLSVLLFWLSARRSKPKEGPPVTASLDIAADDLAADIFQLAAEFRPQMPTPGLQYAARNEGISTSNNASEGVVVAKYLERYAGKAQALTELAKARGLLRSDDDWLMGERPVAVRGIENVARAMIRIAEAVRTGRVPPHPATTQAQLTAIPSTAPVEYTPMPEAARRVYEAIRKVNSDLLEAIETKARNEFDGSALAACADRIWYQISTIHGVRNGTKESGPLPSGTAFEFGFGSLKFSADASALVLQSGEPIWINLSVRETDLSAFLEAIRERRPFVRRFVPLREGGRLAFEAIQSERVAEFVRIGQENDAEAKIDWMIRWFLGLEPPPDMMAIESPANIAVPVSFLLGRPRLVSGTDTLEIKGRILEGASISLEDIGRAIDRLNKSVFS